MVRQCPCLYAPVVTCHENDEFSRYNLNLIKEWVKEKVRCAGCTAEHGRTDGRPATSRDLPYVRRGHSLRTRQKLYHHKIILILWLSISCLSHVCIKTSLIFLNVRPEAQLAACWLQPCSDQSDGSWKLLAVGCQLQQQQVAYLPLLATRVAAKWGRNPSPSTRKAPG